MHTMRLVHVHIPCLCVQLSVYLKPSFSPLMLGSSPVVCYSAVDYTYVLFLFCLFVVVVVLLLLFCVCFCFVLFLLLLLFCCCFFGGAGCRLKKKW